MSASNMARRTAAGTLALAVCIGGGAVALAGGAQAEPSPAAALAAATSDGERTIVVATGAVPFDAIAAGPLATFSLAPILLQAPGTELDPTIGYYLGKAQDEREPVTDAIVVGGEAAVSPAVVDQLKRRGVQVHRISGQDRYATALNVGLELDALLEE